MAKHGAAMRTGAGLLIFKDIFMVFIFFVFVACALSLSPSMRRCVTMMNALQTDRPPFDGQHIVVLFANWYNKTELQETASLLGATLNWFESGEEINRRNLEHFRELVKRCKFCQESRACLDKKPDDSWLWRWWLSTSAPGVTCTDDANAYLQNQCKDNPCLEVSFGPGPVGDRPQEIIIKL